MKHIGALLFLVACLTYAQNAATFHARLTAVPADARTRPNLTGSGSATASLTGAKLDITGTFDGLHSAAATASVHSSVAAGVRGPSIADLTVTTAVSGSFSGSVDLTPDQLASLRKGGLYLEIATNSGAGKPTEPALWGWLLH